MAEPVTRNATYEDLLRLPEHVTGEILDGDLYAMPRPRARHAKTETRVSRDLDPFDRQPGSPGGQGGWCILIEPELHLGRDVVVPDLAGWRRERMPTVPDVAAFDLAPDWACEIVSPRTASIDRVLKMRIYAREHVGYVWIIDPEAHTLEVFRLDGDRWILASSHSGNGEVRAGPFDAVALEMGRWWLAESSTGARRDDA